MIIGRTIGWLMVVLAIMMGSGEAVMALGATSYPGLATSEIVTLLVGEPVGVSLSKMPQMLAALGTGLLAMPAWVVIGPIGLALTQLFRARRVRRRRFRTL